MTTRYLWFGKRHGERWWTRLHGVEHKRVLNFFSFDVGRFVRRVDTSWLHFTMLAGTVLHLTPCHDLFVIDEPCRADQSNQSNRAIGSCKCDVSPCWHHSVTVLVFDLLGSTLLAVLCVLWVCCRNTIPGYGTTTTPYHTVPHDTHHTVTKIR